MSDNYHTPDWLKTMFLHWCDPCPFNPDPTHDGLQEDWTGCDVFVNPPYSHPSPWVDKAIETAITNRLEGAHIEL